MIKVCKNLLLLVAVAFAFERPCSLLNLLRIVGRKSAIDELSSLVTLEVLAPTPSFDLVLALFFPNHSQHTVKLPFRTRLTLAQIDVDPSV